MPALKQEVTESGTVEKEYTVADIYRLPEGQRAELIDGKMYDMAAPTRTHQQIALNLAAEIRDYIRRTGGSCEVDIAPFAVFLKDDDRNYVEPDVSVVCDPGKLDDDGCHGAPDWIAEVVSPGSIHMDYINKLYQYRTAHVREYWIIDPLRDRVTVYNFERDSFEVFTFADVVPVGIYDGLAIDFKTVRP